MKPFDRASRIVLIETVEHNFVVSLTNGSWRVPFPLFEVAQRADNIALIARLIISEEIAKAEADACCAAGAEIDRLVLAGRIQVPSQASAVCRELARLHLKDRKLDLTRE